MMYLPVYVEEKFGGAATRIQWYFFFFIIGKLFMRRMLSFGFYVPLFPARLYKILNNTYRERECMQCQKAFFFKRRRFLRRCYEPKAYLI